MERNSKAIADPQHPVAQALRQRPDGARIALVVEGGGMRGAVSGGMALGLDELGFTHAFDAAYGASAGTLNAMWLISGQGRDGVTTWTDPDLLKEMINWRRAIGSRPIVDVETLVERRYEELSPGLFDSVLKSGTELHPIATSVNTGSPVDLHDHISDEASLRRSIRASATLPILSGPPVQIGGVAYLDAGLSAAIPIRAAITDGATHILVLRSRQQGEVVTEPSGTSARLTTRMLARIDPAVARAYLNRARGELADEALLARHDLDPQMEPHILSIRPAGDSPAPGRLELDIKVVKEGLEAGRQAIHSAIGPRLNRT